MSESTIRLDPLDVLVTEFTARQRRGECPTIEEYAERYPELADEIRILFPTIATLEKMKAEQQRTPDGRVSLAGHRLERLGDFRLIREIGRGGMGIVYEAEQQSLARRVAVKVLPRQALIDRKHLLRFQREAQTAARLHHTNIVPVFGVGQHDGFHFYVMQLIDGVSLDRVLARLKRAQRSQSELDLKNVVRAMLETGTTQEADPSHGLRPPNRDTASSTSGAMRLHDQKPGTTTALGSQVTMTEAPPQVEVEPSRRPGTPGPRSLRASYWKEVARIGVQVADALQYAHDQGTLHRDIKPANLIIDRQNVAWVADFGLAKVLEDQPSSHSGDIMGTLAYMAPEQLQGHADHRSDIYSLGLTLYELITLRRAFPHTDRTQLLQSIDKGEVPRPRQVRPEVPKDLEAVVLKAMSRDPSRRYQSAAQLAEDLRRFLENRPVRARRATAVERSWRWCRRNPIVAFLSATAGMLLVLVAVIASIGYARTHAALEGERLQRKQAEAATDVALQVLDRIYERFAPPEFDSTMLAEGLQTDADAAEPKPVLSEGAAAVLEDLLTFYDKLAAYKQDDSLYLEKVALACRRVGDIRHHLGQCREAKRAYQRALELYQQLDLSSGQRSHAVEIAALKNQLAIMDLRLGHFEEARQRFQDNLQFLQSLTGETASNAQLIVEAARAKDFLKWLENPTPLPPHPPAPGPPDQGPPGPRGRPPGPPGEGFGPPAKDPGPPVGRLPRRPTPSPID